MGCVDHFDLSSHLWRMRFDMTDLHRGSQFSKACSDTANGVYMCVVLETYLILPINISACFNKLFHHGDTSKLCCQQKHLHSDKVWVKMCVQNSSHHPDRPWRKLHKLARHVDEHFSCCVGFILQHWKCDTCKHARCDRLCPRILTSCPWSLQDFNWLAFDNTNLYYWRSPDIHCLCCMSTCMLSLHRRFIKAWTQRSQGLDMQLNNALESHLADMPSTQPYKLTCTMLILFQAHMIQTSLRYGFSIRWVSWNSSSHLLQWMYVLDTETKCQIIWCALHCMTCSGWHLELDNTEMISTRIFSAIYTYIPLRTSPSTLLGEISLLYCTSSIRKLSVLKSTCRTAHNNGELPFCTHTLIIHIT